MPRAAALRNELRPRGDVEALENVVQVNLDGTFSDVEYARYFLVGHSLNQQCYDLPLPRGQALVLLIAYDFRLCLTITAQKQLSNFFR